MQLLHTPCKQDSHHYGARPFDRSFVFQCADCGAYPWTDRDENGRLAPAEDVKVFK